MRVGHTCRVFGEHVGYTQVLSPEDALWIKGPKPTNTCAWKHAAQVPCSASLVQPHSLPRQIPRQYPRPNLGKGNSISCLSQPQEIKLPRKRKEKRHQGTMSRHQQCEAHSISERQERNSVLVQNIESKGNRCPNKPRASRPTTHLNTQLGREKM